MRFIHLETELEQLPLCSEEGTVLPLAVVGGTVLPLVVVEGTQAVVAS